MGWMKAIDWQLVAFVAGSLVQEYLYFKHIPKIHYWNGQNEWNRKHGTVTKAQSKKKDDDQNRVA